MSDDSHLRREELARAEEARRILESPLWDQAFRAVESQYSDVFHLDVVDAERLQAAHASVRALRAVRQQLETHIQTGLLAERQMEKRYGRA